MSDRRGQDLQRNTKEPRALSTPSRRPGSKLRPSTNTPLTTIRASAIATRAVDYHELPYKPHSRPCVILATTLRRTPRRAPLVTNIIAFADGVGLEPNIAASENHFCSHSKAAFKTIRNKVSLRLGQIKLNSLQIFSYTKEGPIVGENPTRVGVDSTVSEDGRPRKHAF
jgi:hypothetical protein